MGRSDICSYALGTTFRAKRWLALDVCGTFCVVFSFSIHAFAIFVISTRLVQYSLPSLVIFSCIYCPAAAMALISLFVAWTTDPGAVPMGARPLEVSPVVTDPGQVEEGKAGESSVRTVAASRRGIRRCRKCDENYKPPRAHHDSVTGRCIVKMDHFCPWVGNAVGALNHKYFFLFILYTLIASILSLLLLGMRTIRCGYMEKKGDGGGGEGDNRWLIGLNNDSDDEAWDYKYPGCEELYTKLTAALFVISVMFMIFTCTMLTEQIDAITSSTGKIARMKIRAGRGDARELAPVGADQFNEMFGGDSPNVSLHWFLPWVAVRFPDGMHDAVMGYEYDPSWGDAPYREPEEDGFQSEPADGRASGEREQSTTLRAGGVAAAVPPLVPTASSSSATAVARSPNTADDVTNSMHSTASTSSSARKRSTSRTRGQGNGKDERKQPPEIV